MNDLMDLTDNELKQIITEYFQTYLNNFGGDELYEGPCNCDESTYEQAVALLPGAQISIAWRNDEG